MSKRKQALRSLRANECGAVSAQPTEPIRALQPKIQPAFAGLIFGLRTDRSEPVRAHDQYADEQLATAQKRIFLIEFLPSGWLLFIQCQILMVSVWF